jgi:arylsulfatase A-like enzyme
MNQAETARPNVIVITTDQQRRDSLSCYGSRFTNTPHIDGLASEGVVCDRAYTPNPVCTPARASLFSGQYMSRHGAWNVGMNVPESTTMLSHRLGQLGYRTHYIGKKHFQAYMGKDPSSNPSPADSASSSIESRQGDWEKRFAEWHGPYYGFDRVELCLGHTTGGLGGHYGLWVKEKAGGSSELEGLGNATPISESSRFGGRALDWDLPVAWHNSTWTAERSIDFLEKSDPSNPFFLAIGFQDPHHPHALPTCPCHGSSMVSSTTNHHTSALPIAAKSSRRNFVATIR